MRVRDPPECRVICKRRRVAVGVLALVAILAPWAVDGAAAAHVAFDDHHHGAEAPPPGAALHGHGHDDGAPPHEHGSSEPTPAIRAVHGLDLAWTVGVNFQVPPCGTSVSTGCLVSPAASPPGAQTTILRI